MGAPWQTIDAWLKGQGITVGAPTDEQTTGGKHSPTSAHGSGRARDYGNGVPFSDCAAIATALRPFAKAGGPIMELFYDGVTVKEWWDNGYPFTPLGNLRRDHKNHVHVALWPGRVMPLPSVAQPATPPPTPEEIDMVQYVWNDGAVAVLYPNGNVYCPSIPGRPTAKHYGGMNNLKDDAKKAFSGKATLLVGIDPNNSQAGYTIGDDSWGPDYYDFKPGVEKFFK